MALSDEEIKLLQQMEAALAAEDPKLAHTLRGSRTPRTLQRKRAAVAGIGFVVGCIMLIAGMQTHWIVSVVGFLVMLASTIVALTSYRKKPVSEPRKPTVRSATSGRPGAPGTDSSFMDKMEERWKRRQDEGL